MYFSKRPFPFSIITDKGNKLIDGFDKVIIIDNPQNNTLDKLEILDKSPYKETIFIDSDCLAYDDLNRLWEYFLDCDDITTLGDVVSLKEKSSWFDKSTVGEFAEKVDYSLRIHGGLYFIRKGAVSLRIRQLCKYITINKSIGFSFA